MQTSTLMTPYSSNQTLLRCHEVRLWFALEDHSPQSAQNRPVYTWALVSLRSSVVSHYLTELVAQYADWDNRFCIDANPFVTAKYIGTGLTTTPQAQPPLFPGVSVRVELAGIGDLLIRKLPDAAERERNASVCLVRDPFTVAASADGFWAIFPQSCASIDYSLSSVAPARPTRKRGSGDCDRVELDRMAPWAIRVQSVALVVAGQRTTFSFPPPPPSVVEPLQAFNRIIDIGNIPWNALPHDLSKLDAVELTLSTPVLSWNQASLGHSIRTGIPASRRRRTVDDDKRWADMGVFTGTSRIPRWTPEVFGTEVKHITNHGATYVFYALPVVQREKQWARATKRRRMI